MRCFIHSFVIILLAVLVVICMGNQVVVAADNAVSLAWDPSPSQNITGYNLYIGNTSGNYGSPIAIGNQTTYTVTGLSNGTYYFAVTAVNIDGLESNFSNEVFATIGGSGVTCDINGDSAINAIDLQSLANIILGINPSSSNFDVNMDGSVNVLDLQILNNTVLGLRSCQ